jgi:type IV secretion system protein VirB6
MPRTITKAAFLFAFLGAFPTGLFAQTRGPIPITPQTIDFVTSISQSIDQLVTQHTDLFVGDAMTLLNAIAAFQLVRFAIRWMWHPYAMWHAHVDLGELIAFMGKLAGCLILLHYYNQPLPGASFSFHQVFTYTARTISGTIDLSILNDFANQVNSLAANIQQPSPLNIFQVAVYYIVIGSMALVEAVLFAISTLGFIATGIGTLLGPLFIPLLLISSLASKFWKWIDFMFVYAFYRVIASAFVFVWVRVIVGFLQNAIHGDYSIPHLLALLVPWILLQFAFIWSMFQVPHLAHELLGGVSGFGTSLGSAVRGAATRFVRT